METFAAGFQHLVLHLFGWMLPATLLMWICAVLGSHGLGLLGPMRRLVAPIPPVGRVVLLALLVGFIVHGSTKSGGTYAPPPRTSAPRRTPRLADAVTAEDVARGWRESGTDAGGPVEMPAGVVTNDLLRRRGGFDWAFRVEPDGWRFPYRDGARMSRSTNNVVRLNGIVQESLKPRE